MPYLFIFTVTLKAIEDVWFIRDSFLHNNWHSFAELKAKNKSSKPFLAEYYNTIPLYPSVSNSVCSSCGRIFNQFIEGLNKTGKDENIFRLPKYVLIMPDKDILANINFNNYGIENIIDKIMGWLCRNIDRTLQLRKKDIRGKCAGGMLSAAQPRLVWVKMLVRPFLKNVEKPFIFSQTSKFNFAIERVIARFPHTHVMKIWMPAEPNIFDQFTGELTEVSCTIFWKEVNRVIEDFDRAKTELRPTSSECKFNEGNSYQKNFKWSKNDKYYH